LSVGRFASILGMNLPTISKRTLGLIALLLVLFALPITVFIAQKQQETRQRAAEPGLSCGNNATDTLLLFDNSGSMKGKANQNDPTTKFTAAKAAAKSFVDLIQLDTTARIGLVSFADTQTAMNTPVDSPLTTNFTSVKTEIDAIPLSNKFGTCIECAIVKGKDEVVANPKANAKKVFILLTDGQANATTTKGSAPTQEAEATALAVAKSAHDANEITIYTIGLGTDVNSKFLTQIATTTGGKYFFAPSSNDLHGIYEEISTITGKGSVTGYIFNDANNNKVFDTNETKLSGWKLILSGGNLTTPQTITTGTDGSFQITGLCNSTTKYTLTQELQTGWFVTTPTDPNSYTFTIDNGDAIADKNFGNTQTEPTPTPSNTPIPTMTPTPTTFPPTPPPTIPVYFTKEGDTTPISTLSIEQDSSVSLDLYVDAGTQNVNGFDITTTTTPLLFKELIEASDAVKFNTTVFNEITNTNHTLRFSKVNSDTSQSITGKLKLAKISFTAPSTTGKGTIEFPKVIVTSPSQTVALLAKAQPVAYTIDASKALPVYFTKAGTTTPVSSLTVASSPVSLDLYIDAGTNDINGFDIVTKVTGPLTYEKLSEATDATKFNTTVFNEITDVNKTLRFSKVSSDTKALITGKLFLATVSLTGSAAGNGTIDFSKLIITSSSSTQGLPAKGTPINYSISFIEGTKFALTLTLSGIGVDIPGSPGNKTPAHPAKEIKVEVYNNTNQLIADKTGTVTYASDSGKFKGTIDMGNSFASGNYNVKVTAPKYLRKLIPAIQNITAGTTNTISEGTLIVGDINGDNLLNILDYNLYASCFNEKANTPTCGQYKDKVDLNDDGKNDTPQNLSDYRLLFASFATQKGD